MGGGGNDNYEQQQAAIEAKKQSARDALNLMFGVGSDDTAKTNATARDQIYQGVRDNAYTAGKTGLDDQRDKAARSLRFELFARGLNGGSEDINQNAMLGRTYDKGILDLGAKADAARADFRNADEQARLGLLQSIDAGMDQGSALSSATNQMGVNSDKAAAAAAGTSLGNLFDDASFIYNQTQAAKGKQAAMQDWWNNYSSSGSSRNKGSTGTIYSGTGA